MSVPWAWQPVWEMGISTPRSGSVSIHECSPVKQLVLMMLSYWHTDTVYLASKFILYCLLVDTLTSSLACLDQARLQTWDPVSMHCRGCEVKVFQNRIQRSAVPPPEASRPCWWGDQAMALTAARWSMYVCTGLSEEWFHTSSWNNRW